MGEPIDWKAQHAIASGCIRELQAKLAKLEHEIRGITFQTPDEKDAHDVYWQGDDEIIAEPRKPQQGEL